MKRFLLLSVFLGGCATATGPVYNDAMIAPPASGRAQFVIYRPAEFGVPRTSKVSINGNESCDLPAKSFAVLSSDPNADIGVSIWDMGKSHIFIPNSGRHYVRVTYDGADPGAAFGLAGSVISRSLDNDGPFVMLEVSKSQAERDLAGLKRGC